MKDRWILLNKFGNRLMSEFRENLELAGEAQNSSHVWAEESPADVTVKSTGVVR